MYSQYRDSGNITGLTDFCQVWLPTGWEPGADTPIVLLALGYGDDTKLTSTQLATDTFVKAIVAEGYGVVTSRYGGTDLFGNPTARAQVEIVADFVQTHTNSFGTLAVGAGKIVTVGFSMGACTTLNWVGNLSTPTDRVKAFVTVNGLVDINYSGTSSLVAAAYPGGVTNSTDDPTTMAANSKYAGLDGWVCYATDDTVISYSSMGPFITSTGATVVSEGAAGHVWTNIANPAVIDAVLAACAA